LELSRDGECDLYIGVLLLPQTPCIISEDGVQGASLPKAALHLPGLGALALHTVSVDEPASARGEDTGGFG
jgi:hypothetical protein